MTDTPKTENRFLDLDQRDLAPTLGIVKLNGTSYNVRAPQGLGIRGMARVETLQRQAKEATARLGANPEDEEALSEIEAVLDQLVLLLVEGITSEQVKGLADWQKEKLVAFFGSLPRPTGTKPPKGSGKRSHGSRSTTA